MGLPGHLCHDAAGETNFSPDPKTLSTQARPEGVIAPATEEYSIFHVMPTKTENQHHDTNIDILNKWSRQLSETIELSSQERSHDFETFISVVYKWITSDLTMSSFRKYAIGTICSNEKPIPFSAFFSDVPHSDMSEISYICMFFSNLLNPSEQEFVLNENGLDTTSADTGAIILRRSIRSSNGDHSSHTPQNVPHIYPYNDVEGLQALQHHDNLIPYIHSSQQYEHHDTKPPPKYIQVYPGAYQPEYTYSDIPRSYWLFHIFKGLFAIWEALQTIAIIYLLYKVTVLTFLPGREETNPTLLSSDSWESLLHSFGDRTPTHLNLTSRTSDTKNSTTKLTGPFVAVNNDSSVAATNGAKINVVDISAEVFQINSNVTSISDNKDSAGRQNVPITTDFSGQRSSSELADFVNSMRENWVSFPTNDELRGIAGETNTNLM